MLETFLISNVTAALNNTEYKCVVANLHGKFFLCNSILIIFLGENEKEFIIVVDDPEADSMQIVYGVLVALVIFVVIILVIKFYIHQKNKPSKFFQSLEHL